jgi:hypothetical protein
MENNREWPEPGDRVMGRKEEPMQRRWLSMVSVTIAVGLAMSVDVCLAGQVETKEPAGKMRQYGPFPRGTHAHPALVSRASRWPNAVVMVPN